MNILLMLKLATLLRLEREARLKEIKATGRNIDDNGENGDFIWPYSRFLPDFDDNNGTDFGQWSLEEEEVIMIKLIKFLEQFPNSKYRNMF